MKRILATVLTGLSGLSLIAMPARADFGSFLLGVGAGAGTTLLINSGNNADAARRSAPVSPKEEYFRGIQDGTNRARYDNPRNSPDYDRGFKTGLNRSSN